MTSPAPVSAEPFEYKHVSPLKGRERWRFLASPQWVGWFLFTCAVAAVCSMLGQWQFGRRDEVMAVIEKVSANYDRPPIPLADAEGDLSSLEPSHEWTPVELHGTYLADKTLIVRNKQNARQNGYEVLVPFKTDSGDVIAVDRGWLPLSDSGGGRPESVPAPPSGHVTVTVRLRPSEPALDRSAPAGQIATIHLGQVAEKTGLPVKQGAYGALRSEDPSPTSSLKPVEKPSLDEGPHLSYAMQWYMFGLLAFVGLIFNARRHARDVDDDREWQAELEERAARGEDVDVSPAAVIHPAVRAAENSRRRARLKAGRSAVQSDEAEEDALLDRL